MFKEVRKGIIALAVLGAIAVGASAIASAASNSGTTGSQGSTGNSAQQGAPAQAHLAGLTGPADTWPGRDSLQQTRTPTRSSRPRSTKFPARP